MVGALISDDQDASMVGETLADRWEVVRLLGRGGMSTVYEVRHRNGARAAIKVLNATLARNPRTRERFLREGRIANAVGHPNAVRVLDDQETRDGKLLLVMELLDGLTLRERCQTAGRLELPEVLEIAERLLQVLAAAHAKGILHRDIKPENVFLTSDGGLKVLDFGIAAVRDEARQDASITQSGATLGTPAFMAPEQARGRHAQEDARTDIWAVGATLFFCLTGRHVHQDASTANEALIFAATQRAPPLSRFRPELSADVTRVVDRALALSPTDRWPSAEAMREAMASATRRPSGRPSAGLSISNPWTADTLGETPVACAPPSSWWRTPGRQLAALGVCVVSIGIASVTHLSAGTGKPHPAPPLPQGPVGSRPISDPPALPSDSRTPPTGDLGAAERSASNSRTDAKAARRRPAPNRIDQVQSPPADSNVIPEAILNRRK